MRYLTIFFLISFFFSKPMLADGDYDWPGYIRIYFNSCFEHERFFQGKRDAHIGYIGVSFCADDFDTLHLKSFVLRSERVRIRRPDGSWESRDKATGFFNNMYLRYQKKLVSKRVDFSNGSCRFELENFIISEERRIGPDVDIFAFEVYADISDTSAEDWYANFINDSLVAQENLDKFLINGDGYGSFFIEKTTGIKDQFEKEELYVFPNPCQGVLQIKTSETIKEVVITDMNGKSRILNIQNFSNLVNLKGFPRGAYFLSVKTGRRTLTKKIILK